MPEDRTGAGAKTPHGWGSTFPDFRDAEPIVIRGSLERIVREASPQQIEAWDASIPQLQREVDEVLDQDEHAAEYTAILEYQLPLESRRPDVIFLLRPTVMVLELKGKRTPSTADLDQAAGYARDLECYHRECHGRPVVPVLVPTEASGYHGEKLGVHVAGPDALDGLIASLPSSASEPAVDPERFLSHDAYCPLPTLVQAARELFNKRQLRWVARAHAATEPAVEEIGRIIHDAHATRSRRLVLLTGIPGSGKTLVGLRIVHAHYLDDLASPRNGRRSPTPAVFLSGNGPLVQALQYELRGQNGGGKVFVRGVKDYVKKYSVSDAVPPEHVLVFDEAQRAFDAEQVHEKHKNTPGFSTGKSEPEHFIEFAERIPDWCVVIGIIGSGQEIHIGEEAGLGQWRKAIEGAREPSRWVVHGPDAAIGAFEASLVQFTSTRVLSLDTEIRFHAATELHLFVASLLDGKPSETNREISSRLERARYQLRITRSLDVAKQHLRTLYENKPEARFGLLASSRDRDLSRFGVSNGFQDTKRVNPGPWYGDAEDEPRGRSCRLLRDCVTEFGAQGLELDAALLAWGTDLRRSEKHWSSASMRRYQNARRVKDSHRLRINAYRVLLTRGRDAAVVFVPPITTMDETYEYLVASGFLELR
jgi:hypothetical protein